MVPVATQHKGLSRRSKTLFTGTVSPSVTSHTFSEVPARSDLMPFGGDTNRGQSRFAFVNTVIVNTTIHVPDAGQAPILCISSLFERSQTS
jgi:hypothetical protein